MKKQPSLRQTKKQTQSLSAPGFKLHFQPELPPSSGTEKLFSLLPYVLFLAALTLFLGNGYFAFTDFPLDDAWIHRVYSRSFAFLHGLQYNGGAQEAGSTSPLWAIVTAPAHWLEPLGTTAVVIAVKAIGVILGGITLFFVQKISERLTASRFAGVIAASLFTFDSRFVFSMLSGMENILLVALMTGALYALIRNKILIAAVLIGLTPSVRPEALLFLPLFVALLFFNKDFMLKKPLIWVALLTPAALWSMFCLSVNGHLFPNTFYLKAESFHLGADQIGAAWQVLTEHGYASSVVFLFALLAGIAWLYLRKDTIGKNALFLFVLAPALFLIGIVGTRNVDLSGYYWTRWADPASLLFSVLCCFGIAVMFSAGLERNRAKQAFRAKDEKPFLIVAGIGLILFAFSVMPLYQSFADRRFHLEYDSRAIHIVNVQAGEWIDKHLPQDVVVGVNDAGALRYFGKRFTIDLKGLNNTELAFDRVSHEQVIAQTDWLAVFPSWFEGAGIFDYFNRITSFAIPLEQYTVCNCPGQIEKVIYQKREKYRFAKTIH